METKKQCSKRKVLQPLDKYRDGRTQCDVCLEQKRRYRENYRDELKQRAKAYYEKDREELCEKQTIHQNQKVECPLCKRLVGKYRMKQHEQTFKHQMKISPSTTKEVKQTREAWAEQQAP